MINICDFLLEKLKNDESVSSFLSSSKLIPTSGVMSEALIIASSFKQKPENILIIKNSLYAAQMLYERLSTLTSDVLLYPSDESLRIEAFASSKELLTQRLYVLHQSQVSTPKIIIAHVASLIRPLPTVKVFKDFTIKLEQNQTINLSHFIDLLLQSGYQRTNKVERSMQFATRGGVVDVFSLNYEDPLRIEFFDQNIDDIRFFNIATQRTIKKVSSIEIIPANDLLLDQSILEHKIEELRKLNKRNDEELAVEINSISSSYSVLLKYYSYCLDNKVSSLLDYCSNYKVVVSELEDVKQSYELISQETWNYLEELIDAKKDLIRFNLFNDLYYILDKTSYLRFDSTTLNDSLIVKTVNQCKGNGALLVASVKQAIKDGQQVIFCIDNPQQKEYLDNIFNPETLLPFNDQKIGYVFADFKEGFELSQYHLMIFTPLEIFGKGNISKLEYSKYKNAEILKSWENLHPGDYVVHEMHGIGKFIAIQTIEIDGIHRDYLHILYRDDQKLYVPLEKFHLVRKYVSREGASPKLSRLGTSDWAKTKKRIKEKLNDIADRLIALHQKRSQAEGFACELDDELENAFSAAFPYQLTVDQSKGYLEIRKDMSLPIPMDRLLCGDVGFGKTEVALRAAYLAIINGKQVMLLCPTTILSRQHYHTAFQRFLNFNIRIGLLNRFVTPQEVKITLEKLKNGEIDLIIGTHRLLSKDVQMKNLGLLIVDEEQRFGVEHKEKIKELKVNIDVLTLSATPIPRTMQMSLLGIRNLSQINTPPLARMPIQTYVLPFNERLLKELIERELGRHGQVFFLHNEIFTLSAMAKRIQNLIPHARIGIGHGKMDRQTIEDVMNEFYEHQLDILVSTSIIENGIDIPNANTIIINNADRFGLSQLYQIKGRVGRGDRLGYAYLFYHPEKVLTEDATKRLKTIKEFAELGSGYKIAMRDLSIRGAGDILGSEQTGFIESLGMDMYIKILQETIEEKQLGVVEEEIIESKPLHLDAYIPHNFETNDNEKIELYKQMDRIKTFTALYDLQDELSDIYGKIPQNVLLLIKKKELDLLAKATRVVLIDDNKSSIELTFCESLSQIDRIGIMMFEQLDYHLPQGKLFFNSKRIRLLVPKKNQEWLINLNAYLAEIKKFLEKDL